MKKLSFIILSILLSISLFALPVSEKTARETAISWYSYKAKGSKSTKINKEQIFKYESKTALYIFTFEGGGFVIISADDSSLPILGYSVTNYFQKDNSKNEIIENWLLDYAKQVIQNSEANINNYSTKQKWDNILNKKYSSETKDVSPLIQTTWDQTSGYDTYCPSGTPTGCVATSIAQIMKYQFDENNISTSTGVSKHSYVHPTYGEQSANFGQSTYNWGNMSLYSGNTDIAKLIYDVGVSIDMDYETDGSGSQTYYLLYALPNYFKFDHDIKYVEMSDYNSTDWNNLLKSEIDQNRPIEYAGSSANGSGGHAFVLDGYDSNGKFHVNWGWGSYADGYFAIGSLNPNTSNFNAYNSAVINIKLATNPEFIAVSKPCKLSDFATNNYAYLDYISAPNDTVAWAIGADGSSAGANYRIYTKTLDGGQTWTAQQVTNLGGTAFSMVYALNTDTAYIAMWGTGSDNQILRTYNGGTNWSSILNGAGSSSFFNVVHFFNKNDGFVEGDPENNEFELYTSSDGGDNWTRVPDSNIPNPLKNEYGITGHYTAVGNTIWFTTNKSRIYKSIDKGLNWTVSTIYNTSMTTYTNLAFNEDQQTGLATVSLSDGKSVVDVKNFKTLDGGNTWTEIPSYESNMFTNIYAVPGTEKIFYSAGNGISYTTDGGNNWTLLKKYTKSFNYTSIAMSSKSKGYFGTYSSDYSGGVWVLGNKDVLYNNFYSDKNFACINSDVKFYSLADGNITDYNWNFGDNANPQTATGSGPHTVQYSSKGLKNVELNISNGTSSTKKIWKNYISVADNIPSDLDTVYGPKEVAPNAKITYYVSNPNNDQFSWTFSDNSIKLLNNIDSIAYIKFPTTQKSYNITITPFNGCGVAVNPYTLPVVVISGGANIYEENLSLKIFPNPASNFLNINSENIITKISIISLNGNISYAKNFNSNTARIDISQFEKGMYIISIYNNNNKVTRKIIIQ